MSIRTYRELIAESQVALTIALRKHDGVIIIVVVESVKCNIVDTTSTTSTLEIARESRRHPGPDLDAN